MVMVQFSKKHKVLILVSGRGSNMVSIIKTCRRFEWPVDFMSVISDRPCEGIVKARGLGVNGELLDSPTRESIHVGKNKHIIDKFGIFMNHSFNPNTEIQGYNIVAIKDINPGDEITFDYNVSEVNMASPFKVNGIDVRGKNTSS